jgi:hypothetical protein
VFESVEAKKSKRQFYVAISWTVIGAFLFLFSLPTIIFLSFGGHTLILPQKVYSIKSPDNKYVLDISNRVSLPVISPIDPSGVVHISLKAASNKSELDSVTFEIHEFGELTKPTVIWKTDEAYIENIEYHKEISFKIPLPNN